MHQRGLGPSQLPNERVSMFQVIDEQDIPIPAVASGGGRTPKYPFKSMQVGDVKRFVAGPEEVKRIQRAAAAFTRRNKTVKFTTRRTEDGVRVWRTA